LLGGLHLENTWARQRFRPIGAEAAYRCGVGRRPSARPGKTA
jgi:hypothetical protein